MALDLDLRPFTLSIHGGINAHIGVHTWSSYLEKPTLVLAAGWENGVVSLGSDLRRNASYRVDDKVLGKHFEEEFFRECPEACTPGDELLLLFGLASTLPLPVLPAAVGTFLCRRFICRGKLFSGDQVCVLDIGVLLTFCLPGSRHGMLCTRDLPVGLDNRTSVELQMLEAGRSAIQASSTATTVTMCLWHTSL